VHQQATTTVISDFLRRSFQAKGMIWPVITLCKLLSILSLLTSVRTCILGYIGWSKHQSLMICDDLKRCFKVTC